MSFDLGVALLGPKYSEPRIPVMEHIWGLSRNAIKHFSGIDLIRQPQRINESFRSVARVFEIDLLWGGGLPTGCPELLDWDNGPPTQLDRSGKPVIQWGVFSTARQEDGRHFLHIPKPESVDAALSLDPLTLFPKSVDEYEAEFRQAYLAMLDSCAGDCCPIPHHYTTAFHWPLAIYGFEMLCEAGLQVSRFAAQMELFAEVSRRITTAWSRVPGVRGFILHDDLTTTRGPIFRPSWYRKYIFPHYSTIFAPLIAANIPIIFTSDGNCTEFIDDIFAAGAEGLNFEYLVDMADIAARYPDKILIGNISSDVIARGNRRQIEKAASSCIEDGKRARRFVVNVGGQLTHDMSIENLETYLEVRKALCRNGRLN